MRLRRAYRAVIAGLLALPLGASCRAATAPAARRASGYVEATEVRLASKVPGRVATVSAVEGARVEAGVTVATLSTVDIDLALKRAQAERAQAVAYARLLESGSRPEDIQQAEAHVAAAAADQTAVEAELTAARADEGRFEQLLRNKAGSQKQRDDAVARRELAEARLRAAADRVRAATAALNRLRAGAHPEERAAARARVATVDAEIARLEHDKAETAIIAPTSGIVASRLVEPGELVQAGAPMVVIVDLDHAWASIYVEEPLVPGLRIEQPVTLVSDAGDRLAGRVAFISPRAEFTPRNVQTATERAKLVYRVKVTVDNRQGILKPGMPVEAELAPAPAAAR